MRLFSPIAKTACIILLVLASTPLYSEQHNSDATLQLQTLLADIDTFGADKFDPCKTDTATHKNACNVKDEMLILWTGYKIPPESFKLHQHAVGATPGGIAVRKALEIIKENIKPKTLEWEEEKPVWQKISAAYVKHLLKTQSEVTVYVGPNHHAGSIFCTTELPLIIKSEKKIEVIIESEDAQHDDKLITDIMQWPCGTEDNQVRSDPEPEKRDNKKSANKKRYFAKTIGQIQLADPVKAWKRLLSGIKSNPIISKIDLSKVVHLKSNQFNFHSTINMAGKKLNFTGSLLINPQAQNNDLFAKLEAKLTSGQVEMGSLQTTGATLDVVVVNDSGTKQVHARITPDLKIKGRAFPVSVDIERLQENKSVMFDFELGENISIAEIIPSVANIAFLTGAQVSDIKLKKEQFNIKTVVNKKTLMLTLGPKAAISIAADDVLASDIFPALKTIPALNILAVEKIDIGPGHIEVEVMLNGQKVDLVSHRTKDKKNNYIAIYLDKLNAATFIPAAKGHLVNSLELDKALFIIQAKDSAAQSISASALPGDLARLSGLGSQDKLSLKPGVNFSSQLNVSRSAKLSKIFKSLGVNARHLPLHGTLPISTFTSLAGKGGGRHSGILDGLALQVNLPTPKLSAVSQFVSISGPARLSIGGIEQDKSSLWARLPKSLSHLKPIDGLDMSIQFGVELKNIDIKEKLAAMIDIGTGASKALSLLVLSEGQWKRPFDIPEFTLGSGGFQFSLQSNKGAKRGEFAFFGTAKLGKHNDIDVSADFKVDKGKLALNYFELDGKFSLKDLPGGQYIPDANKYELDEIKLARKGIEAKTVFAGKKVDAFLFEMANNNWVFALDQKNFKFSELLPVIKKIKPLDNIKLPTAAVIISKDGLTGSHRDMPMIAHDLFQDIFGNTSVDMNIPGGIGLIAAFDEKQMGEVGKGLKKLGVHDDAILMGEITGVFQGTPGIMISLLMEQAGKAHGMPRKVISVPNGVTPQFFIQWSGAEFYVGAGLGLSVNVGKDKLHLESKIELDFSEKGVGIDILGEMEGIWKQPFGIKGIEISDLKMKVGINDIGEVLIGFAGHDKIGKEDIKLAAEIKILLEDALPDGVAFSGSMNSLGVPAMIDITETIMGTKGQIPVASIPSFEIHDALLAFATPGASDPQLGIVSGGFAVNGEFFFMNKRLGKISGAANLTSGLTFEGDISDIDLDAFTFKNNKIDMAINLHPKFILDSNIKLLGAQQKVNVDFSPPHFEFDLMENLGHFGDAHLRVRIDGFDLTKGTYLRNSDISVVGEFKSTLVPWMEKQIKTGVTELRQSAKAKLNANLTALNAAQKKVDKLNEQIRKVRASDNRAKSRAQGKLNNAESRISSLKRNYEYALRQSKHCGTRWTHWACAGYWKVKAGAEYEVYRVAIDVLKAVKVAEAAAFDLDPRVAALIAERDIAHAALSIAQGVVKAARAAEDFVLKELESVLEGALKNIPFEIDQAIFIGDLRDMIQHDAPLVLDMKFRMFGTPMREYFAIKLKDPAFDAVSFALLPALALDKMTEKVLNKIDPKIARWIHSHIAVKLVKAEAIVRKQVQAEEKKYAKILQSFEKGGAKFEKAFTEQSIQQLTHINNTPISDLFGDSKTFKNIYLAVGHSRLCLGVAINGIDVIQENCKNIAADRWSTQSTGDGYVQLKNKGLCLKARNKKATGVDPLMLAQCIKQNKHEQWKIISTDGFYDKIVNRYSQKCLHFNKENANPKSAFAVWTSCFGADSQTFRDIKDAERPTWHAIKSMFKAKNGSCLSIKGSSAASSLPRILKLQLSRGKLNRQQYNALKRSGADTLFAEKCVKEEDRFNYIEDVNGDIKLVHERTGWCVHPKPGPTKKTALAPCDRGKDMIWRLDQVKGNAWMLRNVHNNLCLSVPEIKDRQRRLIPSTLARCQQIPSQMFDFVK